MVIVSLAISLALAIIFTARELSRRHTILTIEEALRVGESKTVEFKSTYHWDVKQGKEDDERRLDVLKSIAGLLNTDGGNLYIGVEEDRFGHPSLRGLEEDLRLAGGSKDKLVRSLRDLITTRIGSEFSPFITDWFEEAQNKLCWRVDVERSPMPAFVRWKARGEPKEQKKGTREYKMTRVGWNRRSTAMFSLWLRSIGVRFCNLSSKWEAVDVARR